MRKLAFIKKLLAAVAMTVGALCGGAKASAEQKGTLSIVEISAKDGESSQARTRVASFLRALLDARGVNAAVVSERRTGGLAVWTPGAASLDLGDLPDRASFSVHAVDDLADEDWLTDGETRPGFRIVKDWNDETRIYAIAEEPIVDDGDLAEISVSTSDFNRPVLSFRLTERGGKRFGDWTTSNIGRVAAVTIEDTVVAAPVIREPILGDSGQISSDFRPQDVRELALRIATPPAGVDFKVVEHCTANPPRAPPKWLPDWFAVTPACD